MLFAFYRWSKESQILLEPVDGKKIKTLCECKVYF